MCREVLGRSGLAPSAESLVMLAMACGVLWLRGLVVVLTLLAGVMCWLALMRRVWRLALGWLATSTTVRTNENASISEAIGHSSHLVRKDFGQ